MRRFVVVGHDAPTTPEFSLEDLPGSAGRLDLLARCVIDGLLVSHGVREDAAVALVLGDEFTVGFDGAEVRNLHPDERSTAAHVRTALERRADAVGDRPARVSPGITIRRRGFERTLREFGARGTIVHLAADGEPVAGVTPPADPTFVLSDHRSFSEAEAAVIEDLASRRLSVGPRHLHANQAIAVAHTWLDTDGFGQ